MWTDISTLMEEQYTCSQYLTALFWFLGHSLYAHSSQSAVTQQKIPPKCVFCTTLNNMKNTCSLENKYISLCIALVSDIHDTAKKTGISTTHSHPDFTAKTSLQWPWHLLKCLHEALPLGCISGVVIQPQCRHGILSWCMQRLDLRQDGASVLAVVETCIPQFLLQAHARVFGDLKQGKCTILMHKVSLLVDALSPVNHKDVDQGLKQT